MRLINDMLLHIFRANIWQSIRAKCWLITMLLSLLFCLPAQAQFDPERLSQATVRVVVKVRNQVVAVASGFVWQQSNHVVTSLHVMDPDPKAKIIIEFGKKRRLAHVKSVLPDADLVLLEVRRPIDDWQPLMQYERNKPEYKSLVTALGFNKGALGMSTRELIKGYAKPEVLQHLLPGKAAKVLAETDIPSIDLPIYYLDGSLLPGYSGAPVVNENGDLIGVGNGGLESGASSVSWVIPAIHLSRLTESRLQTLPEPLRKSSALFSLDKTVANKHFISGIRYGAELIPRREPVYQPITLSKFWPVAVAVELETNAWATPDLSWNLPNFIPQEVAYQQFQFTRVKTRSFAQMLASSGDPASFERVLALYQHFFEGVQIDYQNLLFDVYTDAWYGLNIIVPHGADLVVEEGYLLAQNTWMCQTCPFEIQYHVRQSRVSSSQIAQAATINEQQRAMLFLQDLADEHWNALNQESDFSEFSAFRQIDNYGAGRQVLSAAFGNFGAPFIDQYELNYFVAAHNRDAWFEAQGIVNRFDHTFMERIEANHGTQCAPGENLSDSDALSREQIALCRDITRAFWVLASTHFTSFANRLYQHSGNTR